MDKKKLIEIKKIIKKNKELCKKHKKKLSTLYTIYRKRSNDRNWYNENIQVALNNHSTELINLTKQLKKLGIILGCGDYGDDYCLDIKGIEMVLKCLEKLGIKK